MLLDESTLSLTFAIFLFCLGACIGSFLNVVAYRLPLGLSLVKPPSNCPHCSHPVPWWGLIPVVGWFIVRGKCTNCDGRVSFLYPLVEFIVAAGTVWLFFQTMAPFDLIAAFNSEPVGMISSGQLRTEHSVAYITRLFLFYTAVPLTLIDLRYRILPDVITLGTLPLALLLGSADATLGWQGSLTGALVGSGLLYFVAKTYELLRGKEGLGLGDVKYMALIGAVLGWQGVLIVLGLASILGSIVGIVFGLTQRTGLQTALPFGPFLAAAALVVCLWQPHILQFFFIENP
jgi:leader peptidase (prepilin peptidase) / N-methyltransferase